MQRLPFVISRGRVRLAVRLTPKSSSDRILGIVEDGPQGPALRVAVTAAPVDGKANTALIRLLAREFGLAPRDLSIVGGETARRKLVELSGDPDALAQCIEQRLLRA
ncbi:MAG TPA: DUF167 domain-containing protein [Stellaceae bacterium]|nr:DUF167 domain-containing protein [Stellaceae bacterium]